MRKLWLISIIFTGLAGCAHESTITPSQGHIDSGQDAQTAAAPAGEIPKPVKKPAYVPPPKPKVKEQTYSVVVSDVPVREILFALARESKTNIDIHPDIKGNVTMNAVDQSLSAILERISKQVDMTYKLEGNVISIVPDLPVLRTYQINYVNMKRVTTSEIGVAAEISTTGAASSSGGGSGSGANNSNTTVKTDSINDFWQTLVDNIEGILRETDKEQVVRRRGATSQASSNASTQQQASANGNGSATAPDAGGSSQSVSGSGNQVNQGSSSASGSGNQNVQGSASRDAQANVEQDVKDYQTVFAAKVIANKESGVLSIRATNRQHEKIQEFIDKVQASAKKQVLIEATIVEVALNDKFQRGIDWSRLGSNGVGSTKTGFTFKQTLGGAAATTGNQFIVGFANSGSKLGDLAASIRLLETFGNTRVLSSPKLMALNSQTAILKVVNNLVYFTVKSDTTTPATGPAVTNKTSTPHTVPVGVVMSVTPQINENGAVTLNVRPTISRSVGNGVEDPVNPGSFVPEIQVREMESVLQVGSGQTVVLGGLMEDTVDNNTDAVPGVSKLPLIGKLFQGKDNTAKKTELIIFLRPTVIPNASLESDELNKFKQFLPDQLPVVTTDEPAH